MDQKTYLRPGEVPPPGVARPEGAGELEATGHEKVDIQPKANLPVLEMDDFYQFLASEDKPVLVNFWAPWVTHCMTMIPIYEEIQEERDDFDVAMVNVDECKPLASEYSIIMVPTAILFKEGRPVASCSGTMGKEDILEGIEPFL